MSVCCTIVLCSSSTPPSSFFCSQWHSSTYSMLCPVHILKQMIQKQAPQGASQNIRIFTAQSFLSNTKVKLGGGSFPLITWNCVERRDYGDKLPCIFLLASMKLALHLPEAEEPLNLFLNFSQRELVCVLFLSGYLHGRKEGLKTPICHLANVPD